MASPPKKNIDYLAFILVSFTQVARPEGGDDVIVKMMDMLHVYDPGTSKKEMSAILYNSFEYYNEKRIAGEKELTEVFNSSIISVREMFNRIENEEDRLGVKKDFINSLVDLAKENGNVVHLNSSKEWIQYLCDFLKIQMPDLIDNAATDSKELSEDDDDGKGYAGIQVRVRTDKNGKPDEVANSVMRKYLAHWQCPTKAYNGRMGITAHVPSWIAKIDSALCCPQFSEKEIQFIIDKIKKEKTIPVLNYAPDVFLEQTKSVWWIVPFIILNESKVSWLFIDKNGLYAAVPEDEDVNFVLPWDKVDFMDYSGLDLDTSEEEVHSLEIDHPDGTLTLVEFVPQGRGSYLSVIDAIYDIRSKTIEESKGESQWYEGAGGEGFKDFETPVDLLDNDKWENPDRPNPSMFGFVGHEIKPENDSSEQLKEESTFSAVDFYERGRKKNRYKGLSRCP